MTVLGSRMSAGRMAASAITRVTQLGLVAALHRLVMRWHVMVHSVLSFFYNAVVLAAAIGFLTGK